MMYVEAEKFIGKIWRRIRLVRIPKSVKMLNSKVTLFGPLYRVIYLLTYSMEQSPS